MSQSFITEFNGARGTFTPFNLFAGETPRIVTDSAQVAFGQNLAQYTVVAFNASGLLVAHDPGGVAPTNSPVGILPEAVNATAAACWTPYYAAGFFNHAALVWHASLTTLAARKLAVRGTPLMVGALR